MDNARPHTHKATKNVLNELKFILLPHPSSPDISQSKFFLYGMMKKELQGRHHETFGDTINLVDEILHIISKNTFSAVFENWINRLIAVIDRGGNFLSVFKKANS